VKEPSPSVFNSRDAWRHFHQTECLKCKEHASHGEERRLRSLGGFETKESCATNLKGLVMLVEEMLDGVFEVG
jgi:hypothetical protein